MRNLSSITVRAIAASLGAAALVLTLASVTGAPKAARHDMKLAFQPPHAMCPPGLCGG